MPAFAADTPINFNDHIRPIFQQSCNNCHNADEAKGGLDLTSYRATMAGGSAGEIVVSLDAGASRLLGVMNHTLSPKMPPRGNKVADAKLELIRKWIDQGVRETSNSAAAKPKKPRVDLSVGEAAIGRPDGPPIMPVDLPLGPVHHTTRPGSIASIASHPWSPIAAVAGQKQTLVMHTQTGELLGVLPFEHGQPQVMRFSWTGRLLMVGGGIGGQSGTVVLYDVQSGAQVAQVGEEVDAVLSADIDPTQRYVALGGPGKLVKGYSVATGEMLYKLDDHTEWITAIAFSPDGNYLATGDRNGGLRIWEADTGEPVFILDGHRDEITALAWRYDGKVLASAGEDEQARVWEMTDGKMVKGWKAHSGGVRSIAYAEDGRLVTTGRDSRVTVWDGDGRQLKQAQPFKTLGMAAVFDTHGQSVIAGDLSGKLARWSLQGDAKQVAQWSSNPLPVKQAFAASHEHVSLSTEALNKATAGHAQREAELKQADASVAAADKDLNTLRHTVKTNGKVPATEKARKDAFKRRDEANRALGTARTQHGVATKHLRAKEGESKRAHQNHGRVAQDLAKKTAELNNQTKQVEQAQADADELKAQADQIKARAADTKKQADQAKRDADQAKRDAEQAKKQSDQNPEDAGLKQNAKDLAKKAEDLAKKAAELKKQSDTLALQSADQQKRLQAQARKVQDLKRKADQLKGQQKQKADELAKRTAERAAAEERVAAAKKDEAAKRLAMDSAQQMAGERNKEVDAASKAYDQARKDLDQARRSVRPAEDKLKKAREHKEKIAKALAESKRQLESAQATLDQAKRDQVKWRAAEVRLELGALCAKRDQALGGKLIAQAKRDKLVAQRHGIERQITDYKAALADGPNAKKRQQQALKQAGELIAKQSVALVDATNRLKAAELEVKSLTAKRDGVGQALKKLEAAKHDDDGTAKAAIEKQLAELDRQLKQAKKKIASLKLVQEDATYDKEDAEHALNDQKQKLDELGKSLAALPGKIKALEKQHAALAGLVKQAEQAIVEAGKPAAAVQQQIDQVLKRYKAIRQEAGLGVLDKLYK